MGPGAPAVGITGPGKLPEAIAGCSPLAYMAQTGQTSKSWRADEQGCHFIAGVDVAGPGEDETVSRSGRGITSSRSARFDNRTHEGSWSPYPSEAIWGL